MKWKHVIREAHRQWARRLAMGGAIIACNEHWSTYWVPYCFNRRRFYWRGR